jgi:hypothetical protein
LILKQKKSILAFLKFSSETAKPLMNIAHATDLLAPLRKLQANNYCLDTLIKSSTTTTFCPFLKTSMIFFVCHVFLVLDEHTNGKPYFH